MPRPVSLIAALLLLPGCAVISTVTRSRLTGGAAEFVDDGYEDYAGVLHIHTTYSHDAHGTFEDAIRVANARGLDYLVITEHNTLQPLRDGKHGWHGTTLVLIGMEISAKDGHYLALNVTEEFNRHGMTTQQVIDEVNRQGGFGFIAHPYFAKGRWKNWEVTGVTGIESYNVAHDTLDENKFRLALWTLTAPAEPFYFSILDRPYDPLSKWDELIRRRGRVVGIGASDAHEFHLLGLKFAPYEVMFQMARTHVLIPSKTLTDTGVYEALRSGHAYFAIELEAEAGGFTVVAERGGRIMGVMGDEVALEPDLRLTAWLPAPAQLALYQDGRLIDTTTAQSWQVPLTQPGAYRFEASRHDKPWLFSNPIYVRPAGAAVTPEPTAVPPAPKPTAAPSPPEPTTSPAAPEPTTAPAEPEASTTPPEPDAAL